MTKRLLGQADRSLIPWKSGGGVELSGGPIFRSVNVHFCPCIVVCFDVGGSPSQPLKVDMWVKWIGGTAGPLSFLA